MNTIASFRVCKLSDEDLVKAVDKLTDQMYVTGEVPSRHIPARPDRDYDILVGELIARYVDVKQLDLSRNQPEGKGDE